MRPPRYSADALFLLTALALAACGDDSDTSPDTSSSSSSDAATTTNSGGGAGTGATTTDASSGSSGTGGEGGEYEPPPLPELLLAEVPTQSTELAPMNHPRAGHTATLLDDGTVIVIGGENLLNRSQLETVERYDPASDTWTDLPSLPEGRVNHTATLLGDGTILVVGGGTSNEIGVASGQEVRTTALILDPATGDIETIDGPAQPRHSQQAVRLPSGKVLVAGGADDDVILIPSEGAGGADLPFGHPLASAELYDPQTKTFTATGDMPEPHSSFSLVGLADGRVLVSGGIDDIEAQETSKKAAVYDEATGTFAAVSPFDGDDRLFHVGTRLEGGAALIFGGKKANVRFLDDLQRFDPEAGTFELVGEIGSSRTVASIVPTAGGGALVLAGFHCSVTGCSAPPETYLVDADGAVTDGPALLHARGNATATVLPDGSILLVGGFISGSVPYVERLSP